VGDEYTGQVEMRDWLEVRGPATCRRTGLSRYLDGVTEDCASLPKSELCDTCRASGIRATSIKDDLLRAIARRRIPTREMQMSLATVPAVAPPSPESSGDVTLGNHASSLVPETPLASAKRLHTDDGREDAIAKRRALLSSLTKDVAKTSSNGTVGSSPTVAVNAPVSYAARILPYAMRLITQRGVCFMCLGSGRLMMCKGTCAAEAAVLGNGKGTVFDAVNQLGDAVKFKLQKIEHCGFCYLPAGEIPNGFHPEGKHGKCLVFKMMVPKALVYGSRCWVQGLSRGGRVTQASDPAWLRDVLQHWRMLPEPSVTNFGIMLLSKCETGEPWLMRVFYEILKQALSG
jgi:hypothetical protein